MSKNKISKGKSIFYYRQATSEKQQWKSTHPMQVQEMLPGDEVENKKEKIGPIKNGAKQNSRRLH